MKSMNGLGKADRERLSAVLRGTKGTISVAEAAAALGMPNTSVAKLLSRWAKKGWLSRVRRGLYIPVPLESRTADIPLEDAWAIADKLYGPCYIGGWSAAEYWDLTEQIFRTVIVLTTQRPRGREQNIKGTEFLLRSVPDKAMFGLKAVWRGQVKVNVSDPTRTILDMLSNPQLGGGLRSTIDMFRNYLTSEKKDLELLINYADQLANGAVFKRLGFLLEKYAGNEQDFIEQCRARLTTGNAKFDPALKAEKLITRWRLWVPERWTKELNEKRHYEQKEIIMSVMDSLVENNRQKILSAAFKNGIRNVRVFGSMARNEANEDSDLDLLVDLEKGKSGFALGGFLEDVSNLVHRKVDVVTEKSLHPSIRNKVLHEARSL
jgi:predicted transcriptional regulator of viral defense system/predicted nucleotidyltransferase